MSKTVLSQEYRNHLAICLTIFIAIIGTNTAVSLFSGKNPLSQNVYNSYALQAERWLDGHLDLAENYPHLEIAVYNNKYYVSFPPFPSILLLPFAALFVKLFGTHTPDHLITMIAAALSGIYAYRLAFIHIKDQYKSLFFSLFVCVGSNLLFLSNTGYVWFMAQVLAFLFTIMSLYYARAFNGKPALSLFFFCCALGCRPLNAVYLPLLLYLLYRKDKSIAQNIKRLLIGAFPAVYLGCVYMLLNYLRFGSIFEFGHNYLPEFTEAPLGQFNAAYLAENLKTLWRLPYFQDGRLRFYMFNGTAFWLVSPIILAYVFVFIGRIKRVRFVHALIALLILSHLVILCLHKTMGGYHFGHRYTVDILPALFLGLVHLDRGEGGASVLASLPLALWGFAVNILGTVSLYLGYL